MKFLFDAETKQLSNWLYHIKVDSGWYVTNDEKLFEHYNKLIGGLV